MPHRYVEVGTDRQVALAALRSSAHEGTHGLSFVPEAVEKMLAAWRQDGGGKGRYAPDWEKKAAFFVLYKLDKEGVIELRPESGLGRLSQAELDLCPPGPHGTRLSWVRFL